MSELTNRYCFRLEIDPVARAEAKLYKPLALHLVCRNAYRHFCRNPVGHARQLKLPTLTKPWIGRPGVSKRGGVDRTTRRVKRG